MENTILGLFAVPIGNYTIDHKISNQEKSFLLSQKQKLNVANETSINTHVLNDIILEPLRKEIEEKINFFVEQVYFPKYDVNLKITQSWINYTKKGQSHHRHKHPNSFVSGVYYIETSDSDSIYFYNDRTPMIEVKSRHWGLLNSKIWCFPAKKGNLVLFPSSLEHSVSTVTTEKTRISLSFNTFPGKLGDDVDLTELNFEEVKKFIGD